MRFETPDDERDAPIESIIFNFVAPFEMLSIDIVDANGGFDADIIMTDSDGSTRTYFVPADYSNEPPTPDGYETVDLQTLGTQTGEGGGTIPVPTDGGPGTFDVTDVVKLEVDFAASGGIDNLTFIPEPGGMTLFGLGGTGERPLPPPPALPPAEDPPPPPPPPLELSPVGAGGLAGVAELHAGDLGEGRGGEE